MQHTLDFCLLLLAMLKWETWWHHIQQIRMCVLGLVLVCPVQHSIWRYAYSEDYSKHLDHLQQQHSVLPHRSVTSHYSILQQWLTEDAFFIETITNHLDRVYAMLIATFINYFKHHTLFFLWLQVTVFQAALTTSSLYTDELCIQVCAIGVILWCAVKLWVNVLHSDYIWCRISDYGNQTVLHLFC